MLWQAGSLHVDSYSKLHTCRCKLLSVINSQGRVGRICLLPGEAAQAQGAGLQSSVEVAFDALSLLLSGVSFFDQVARRTIWPVITELCTDTVYCNRLHSNRQ